MVRPLAAFLPSPPLPLSSFTRPLLLPCSRGHVIYRPFLRHLCNRVIRSRLDAPPGFTIRPARLSDKQAISSVTAQVFIDDDEITQNAIMQLPSVLRGVVKRILVSISVAEVASQLQKRLPPDDLLQDDEDFAEDGAKRTHVALVAVDDTSDSIIGCVEVGLIDIHIARDSRSTETARLWAETGRSGSGRKREPGSPSSRNGQRAPYVGNLAVAQSFRRRGVAAALVGAVRTHAKHLWSDDEVWLHVEARNAAAVALYRRLGFRCEAREPDWCINIGREPRLFLRAAPHEESDEEHDGLDWNKTKTMQVQLNAFEYVRWCFYDLARTRAQSDADSSAGRRRK